MALAKRASGFLHVSAAALPASGCFWLGSSRHFASQGANAAEHASSSDIHITSLKTCRSVLRLAGPQAIQFLQGMVTNDVRPLEQPGSAPVYASLLTPKGKFLHDLIVYRDDSNAAAAGGVNLLVEVDSAGASKAKDWLTRYKLKRAVTIDDVSSEYGVWAAYGQGVASSAQQGTPSPASSSLGAGWHVDPRLPDLGLRAVLPAAAQPAAPGGSLADESLYRRWRYMHGVAEGEVEIPADKAAPLDYNIDVLNGVSYKKGCYIGQERNSFTHYRGIIRKRLMPFRLAVQQAGEAQGTDVAVGSDVIVDGTGEVAGTVRGAAHGHGVAYLKLSPALKAEAGQIVMRIKSSGGSGPVVQPFRPAWWPREWGFEEGPQE